MEKVEIYYTVEFWNSGDSYKNSHKFGSTIFDLAEMNYNINKKHYDNVELKQWTLSQELLCK